MNNIDRRHQLSRSNTALGIVLSATILPTAAFLVVTPHPNQCLIDPLLFQGSGTHVITRPSALLVKQCQKTNNTTGDKILHQTVERKAHL